MAEADHKCPLCGRPHDPAGYDPDWVFPCACGYLLAFREAEGGGVRLELAEPEDRG